MKCSDVRESNQWTRIGLERRVVEVFEQAHCAISAAHAPDRVNRIISESVIEIRNSLCISAGEISVNAQHVRACNWNPSKRANVRFCSRDVLGIRENS
jgi:hypothetical protein